ncbi:uncharacterized protein LOC135848258 isoform X1 [Planococcus citri]|uniref:uncharacterized protein LOC135848258 isoform X1 n=1 Tax=Planococcus citri TaxID=170843 RepID=UPI0031F7663F
MDEIISDLNDAIQTAPVDLKELSAITIARDIWRSEVNYYRANGELEKFDPKECISLKTTFSDFPAVIYNNMIEEYVAQFGLSMENWLEQHYNRVFLHHYSHKNNVLEHFDDFVCDYNGTIHYSRTAERMMRCNKFGDVEKFKIACTYFFEDDIRRIWPSVCEKIDLNEMRFRDYPHPQLYYWICCLRNELRKIRRSSVIFDESYYEMIWERTSWEWRTVDKIMFDYHMPYNGPSVEYFWNRIPYEDQFHKAVELYKRDIDTFVRFILPKFDEHQLNSFVDRKGCSGLIYDLLRNCYSNERIILRTWLSMKNKINERNFIALVLGMLQMECSRHENLENHDLQRLWLCRKIWYSAPQDLKRLAIKQISTKLHLFTDYRLKNRKDSSEFLLTVLNSATFEERSSFWTNSWHNLILGKSVDDLQQIMELCFENADAIIQYKRKVMEKSKHVHNLCVELIKEPNFEELNDFVNFCYPNKDTARLFKQQLLQSNLLHGRSVFRYQHFSHATQFNKFICDAYNKVDLATNFKNQLMLSPVIQHHLPRWVFSVLINEWNRFLEFLEIFVSSEQMAQEIKSRLIDYTRQGVSSSDFRMLINGSSFDQILLWCLGSIEEVRKFKKVYF